MTDVQVQDDDYFIIFEQDFEDWNNDHIKDEDLNKIIARKLGRMGYRVMKQKPNAEEMQDAIWAEIKNGGEVIFYGIDADSEDGEFSKLSEDDDPTVELYELNKALYLLGDFDSGYSWVTPHTSNEDEMLVVPDIGGNEIDSNLMSHMGIDERAFKQTIQREVEWRTELKYATERYDYYGWFTNSVLIPQPYNMRLPSWLVKKIKAALFNTKL